MDDEKQVEFVTPTGELMEDDKLAESEDESQSSMEEIEAIRSQMMAVQARAQSSKFINTNNNLHNKRDSEEMGVQLALISAEKEQIEKNKANVLNVKNSSGKDQFGLVLNDSKIYII